MSLKTFSRARLLALAGAILLGLALSAPTFHSSYAQAPAATAPAPAPDAAAPAAAPADAGPQACDGVKITENCTPNSGDTAWMLTSMAIVLMMTIPGLALFYGGMVRKKNVGDTVMTSFAITCLISILWLFFTYSLAFRAGTPFIGGLDRAFLQNMISNTFNSAGVAQNIGTPNSLAPTIPESVYSMFQLTFAIITAALIAGSFAERMKFSAMLVFIGLWAISLMMCWRPARSNPPINQPMSTPKMSPPSRNARLYVKNSHRMLIRQVMAKLVITVSPTFFLRTMPP